MKKSISFLTLVCVCALLFAGCNTSKITEDTKMNNSEPVATTEASTVDNSEPVVTTEASNVDSGEYSFFNTSWTRDAEHDTETIRFGEDGSFSYSCGCGNPVNDADLCEGYTYDAATKTITLNCIETTEEMITSIQVVKCDANSLHLDFGGEIRIFER